MKRLVVLALLLLPATASAEGQRYIFRTLDSGDAPTAEQDMFCDNAFSPFQATVITRLNARLYSFTTNAASGRIGDQTARELGPGFICGAPSANGLDAAAFTELPGTGRQNLRGSCGLRPLAVNPGELSVTCVLPITPSPAEGVLGGLATSNSIVDRGGSGDVPTGSVWTAFVARSDGGAPTPDIPAGPPPAVGDVPGIEFLTLAAGASEPTTDPDCRTAPVSAVAPELGSGRIPATASRGVGRMVLCGGRVSITVPAAGPPLRVDASGTCSATTVPGSMEPIEHCAMTVAPSGPVRDGTVTSNGNVWTVALLGAPEDVAAPARARLRVPARSRAGRVRLRWSADDPAARFDLQVRRRGGDWRFVLQGTERTTAAPRLRRGRVAVRVRISPDGPWTRGAVRVRRR